MSKWYLPGCVTISGKEYKINTDFRNILEIISILSNREEIELTRVYAALMLFFEDFNKIKDSEMQEALNQMMLFINCGEDVESNTLHKPPKLIDWNQDYMLIVSDVNKVAGKEVRAEPHLHWWTFISYFMAIGEGQLSTIVAIRDKLSRGKKLEKWERDFYKQNREKIDFKHKYTEAEQEFINTIIGR